MSDQPSIAIPLTPERRLTRVAAILARGIFRFRPVAEHSESQNLGNSRLTGLEVVSESRLCVLGRPETGDWRLETGDWRLETGDWRLETGDWRLETGGGRR
jgi:hypothetical protein